MTKSDCVGAPGTEGAAAAWVSLAGQVAASTRQAWLGLHTMISNIAC